MIGAPKEIFGTKLPSITSKWTKRTPARSAFESSSQSSEKSAARSEGASVYFMNSPSSAMPLLLIP